MLAFVDLNLCGRDTAAVDPFDFEGGVEIEGGSGLVEDLWIDSGVDEGSEKHVAGDAGEAIEVGDSHGVIVSWARGWSRRVYLVITKMTSLSEEDQGIGDFKKFAEVIGEKG